MALGSSAKRSDLNYILLVEFSEGFSLDAREERN